MREFDVAYSAWAKVNITQPWEIARMQSFYVLKPNDSKGVLKTWRDVFPLNSDKRVKMKPTIFINKLSEEEKRIFETVTGEKADG